MENYERVLPRDLFNEAKLLKCVGRLVLLIEDKMAPDGLTYEHETHEEEGFTILQEMGSGALHIYNLRFYVEDKNGDSPMPICIFTSYNSREPYPAFTYFEEDEIAVFDAAGNLTPEFVNMINTMTI